MRHAGRAGRHGVAAAMAAALVAVGAGAVLSAARQPDQSARVIAATEETPGAPHAGLCALEGNWTTESVFSIGDGAEPAAPEAGVARIEALMDGRFIAIHESGTSMDEAMESMKVFGFNNAAGLYEATWIYTGSTAMMRARGYDDPDTGVLTFQAQYASGAETSERFIITLSIPRDGADEGAPESFMVRLTALAADGSAGAVLETRYVRAE